MSIVKNIIISLLSCFCLGLILYCLELKNTIKHIYDGECACTCDVTEINKLLEEEIQASKTNAIEAEDALI